MIDEKKIKLKNQPEAIAFYSQSSPFPLTNKIDFSIRSD